MYITKVSKITARKDAKDEKVTVYVGKSGIKMICTQNFQWWFQNFKLHAIAQIGNKSFHHFAPVY